MIAPEIESLFAQLEQSLKREKRVLDRDRPIYIYGAGNIGKEVFRIAQREKLDVAGFLDRNAKADSSWEQIAILPPGTDKLSREQRRGAQVIIGIFNRDADIKEVTGLLTTLGFGHVFSFLEFHDAYYSDLGDRYWLTQRSFYSQHKQAIAEVDQLWSDEASREVFRSLLKFRFTLQHDALPVNNHDAQYFPADIPAWPSPLRFADCGAFDGDTLRYLADPSSGISLAAVAAFEPDQDNFRSLTKFAASGALKVSETVCLFPCAVGGENALLRFSQGRGEASSLSETGDTVIQCVTLDSALVGFRPNLIKMDIEGSEIEALAGARQIIQDNQPGLALCVYHRPSHLWEIPALVQNSLPGGKHYLRAHALNDFDVVYYRLP